MTDVCVMPPEVEIVQIRFKGDNCPLPEECAVVAQRLLPMISKQLEDRGFTVRGNALGTELLSEDPQLRFELSQAQKAFSERLQELYKTPTMSKSRAKKCKASLGPAVNRFADLSGVSGLVFVKMTGYKKSKGEVAKDVAMTVLIAAATLGNVVAVQPTAEAALWVSLVDADTGNLLWSNSASITGDIEYGGLSTLTKTVFEGFPK